VSLIAKRRDDTWQLSRQRALIPQEVNTTQTPHAVLHGDRRVAACHLSHFSPLIHIFS